MLWSDTVNLGYLVLNLVNARNILSKSDNWRSPSRTPTHTPSRSPSPDPENPEWVAWETIRAKNRRENEKDYHDLIEMGGRPAFPLELSQALLYSRSDAYRSDAYRKYADAIRY